MASSATAKPQKRLRDFLNEQQEPFILEVYLSEREYSKRSSSSSEKSASLNKRRKALLPFCKALTTILHNKLGFHSESNILTREHEQIKSHATVSEPGQVDHIVQFSSASGSTQFNYSCPDINVGTSLTPHKDQNSFSSHIFQSSNACNKKRQKQRCIEGNPESLGKIPLSKVLNVNEDSLLSTAVWSLEELLPGPDVSHILKSKRVLHKVKKQLLFDFVRDVTRNFPTKEDKKHDYKQFLGLELGKIICQRTKDWGQHAGAGANLTCLLTMDYLNSMVEWSKFESHVTDISVDVTDAILESINNEIVSEMVGTLVPNV